MAIIGIDLGTTNSLVSCFKDGQAIIIPNALGDNLTPSVVSIDKNSEIHVGKVAKERLISDPTVSIANFKRFMGTEKKVMLGKYNFTPEELSSFILKSLKEDAQAFLGEEITEAVISVPAYFNDFQRRATKVAGELAGLKVERLISEPTAAALAYGLYESKEENQFLIFDLGGGTFDVSILDFFNGVAQVKAVAGDNFLGGEDFNKELINYFLGKNNIRMESLSKIEIGILHKQAEKCKLELSDKSFGEMNLNHNDTEYKDRKSVV